MSNQISDFQKLKILKNKVKTIIEKCKKDSSEKYGVAPKMKVLYDLESVSTLGQASYKDGGTMRLNKYLLLEFGDAYINDIVVHEYAHFIVYELEKAGTLINPAPHGREFKQICSFFGVCGNATTNLFDNSVWLKEKRASLDENKKFFNYECGCSTYPMSSYKHLKILRGASYTCRKCRQKLKLIG